MKLKHIIFFLLLVLAHVSFSQSKLFTKEDTLLGSNTKYRNWWDVKHYDVNFKPDYFNKSISGNAIMRYEVISDSLPFEMQIDLQDPLQIDSILFDQRKLADFKKSRNRYMLILSKQKKNSIHSLNVFYHGIPKVARNPPWDGGFVWKKDSVGNPWISVACQGAGASIWFPCKDIQSDEPDNGALLTMHVPDTLQAIGNGKLISKKSNGFGLTAFTWEVTSPINTYDIIPYIGKYTKLKDSIVGESGKLVTDYWVLNYHVNNALKHLKPNVEKTLQCLEYWFGPYPFYKDSYKIVESPYLGMEHQSNIAYGNLYQNGYLGKDLSNTGWGLKWDFIVVHETAHEWFGNSVTAADVADNWIHEGFASYAEVLFTECEFGKEAGNDYCEGIKKSIINDVPVIGIYNVKNEGSGDMYNKGSNVIHMIRQLINDDEKFRTLIRDISKTFYHKTVSTKELENFVILKTGINLSSFFDQYLRTINIPILEYKISKNKLSFRYSDCLKGFNMPLNIKADQARLIKPASEWQTIILTKPVKTITVDRNMYVQLKLVK